MPLNSRKKNYPTWGLRRGSDPSFEKVMAQKFGTLSVPTATKLIHSAEKQAKKALRDRKLSDNWLRYLTKTPDELPDEMAFHMGQILIHAARVRYFLQKKKAQMAVVEAIFMMNAVADSQLTVVEPDAYRGHKLKASSSAGGMYHRLQRDRDRQLWQSLATKIWEKQPELSLLAAANQISEKTGGKTETIRRYIKKL
jgi:hypothetical protein